MGLFTFIKKAGQKLFGNDDKTELVDDIDNKSKLEQAKAQKLELTIRTFKLQVEGLNIKIDDDLAVVSGLAYDQATKEKVVLIIGNSYGISSVYDRMEVENIVPESVFHTVSKGDTLGKIAKEHYGNAMKYPLIFEANKPMLKDPNLIYPGQVLRIPAELD